MSESEQDVVNKALAGLTMLDTLQSEEGASKVSDFAHTQQEKAVMKNIEFMESVHAKSYSTIFTSLNSKEKVNEIFEWADGNELLQNKARIINEMYQNGDELTTRTASVFLESFLFYSGFFIPLYHLGNGKLVNTAEIIRLIIRDESVHGSYIGAKAAKKINKLSDEEREEYTTWAYMVLMELYENEIAYTHYVYDQVGLSDEVIKFVEYNANKALMNLGLEPIFPTTANDVNPIIMNGISVSTASFDFFSQVGNGYLMGNAEAMEDEDYTKFAQSKISK